MSDNNMKIIIAPAKKMRVDQDTFLVKSEPAFLDKTQELLDFLKTRSFNQLQELWKANDNIVRTNQNNLVTSELDSNLTPALLAFSGIQYQYLAGDVLPQEGLDYLQDHLRILSGFYGILRPFDGIISYRLELKTQMTGFKYYSLYNFWKDLPYQELFADTDTVINLASLEYSRLISPYLKDSQKMITIKFLENKNGKWRQSATHAKMARGEMVRFAAKEGINRPEDLKEFSDFGYVFSAADSSKENYIFKKL
ncbi:peroxide stress protein YaaA [Lactobacillus johnsonii]|uniref:peroxide stress protein YaaA n=1 Tax=Lactobacillus johnsonii TaxID=33959 RepID=UPI00147671A6|nr:peroxide stress protein YaaA [Lactobacillus johnsonii]NME20800.1 peroxide stress protein YaaA [Lactobacillus johnsonii]